MASERDILNQNVILKHNYKKLMSSYKKLIKLFARQFFEKKNSCFIQVEKVIEKQVFPEEAQVMVNYFEDVWLGRRDRRN